VCEHRSSFVWDVKDISVTLLALFVLERCIGLLTTLFSVVRLAQKMNDNVFYAMRSFGIEKIKRILRHGKVTVHTIGHKTLTIVNMG